MMIDPETYYEEYLEGKTAEEIQTEIRSLKREIGHLKNTMEHPDYPYTVHVCPDESVRLSCSRDYLERAKKALADIGAEYRPTKAELFASDFDENISAIQTFTFSIGGFCEGYETHTITFDGEKLINNVEHSLYEKPSNFYIPPNCPMTKNEFLSAIKEMYIGEWRHHYDIKRFGMEVLDGTEWDMEITYSNGHKPISFSGYNAYPYNFSRLKELFGIDEDITEEDEEE